MIIDAYVQIGKSIHGYELSPEKLFSNMEKYGIDRSVVCPVQPYTYHLEPENDYISTVVEHYPQSLIGFCRIDPRQKNRAVEEVQRCVEQLGLQGVFLHPWEEGYRANADFVVPVLKKAAELEVPVMIATGFPWVSHALQVGHLAGKVPEVPVIMTHGGQINISGLAQSDAALAMEMQPNLFMETSGVYRQDFIEKVIEDFGEERVFFGSNAPQKHQGFEFDRAVSATKNSSCQKGVLGQSLEKLLKLNQGGRKV